MSGGTLRLVATRTRANDVDAPYESAMIRSKQAFRPDAKTSLYLTARMKLPDVRGSWPAFWLIADRKADGTSVWPPEIDIMEGAHSEAANDSKGSRGKGRRVAEETPHYASLNPAQAAARLKALEQQMYQHARDLEFEDAARLRDEIHQLREASLVL